MPTVNDIHSGLNPSSPARVVSVASADEVRAELARAVTDGLPVVAAGGRHAMGGQQFVDGGVVLDTRPMGNVLEFDRDRGLLRVQAGIDWPGVVAALGATQDPADPTRWVIRQKQSGADRFTLGGTVSANGHGRGLGMAPLGADVEALEMVDADGRHRTLSREHDPELFSLVIGGYGLFGVITAVTLRLERFQLLQRVVEVRELDGVAEAFEERREAGFVFGDFQFSIDERSPEFLRRGVFSCYRPVDPATPIPAGQRVLSRDDWRRLLLLAHTDRAAVYRAYTEHYLHTDGQLYASDTLQMADYDDGYHQRLDSALGSAHPATEMISELYVPRPSLEQFMSRAAELLRSSGVAVIYGTIRVIERDTDTVLAWARERWACVIFNLCTEHTAEGIARSRAAFSGLIDLALEHGGSYFLTYHQWASHEQLVRAHPRFAEFVAAKRRHDPGELFKSDWYRHYAGAGDGK